VAPLEVAGLTVEAVRQNRVVLARQGDRSVRCGSSRSTVP